MSLLGDKPPSFFELWPDLVSFPASSVAELDATIEAMANWSSLACLLFYCHNDGGSLNLTMEPS